MDGELHTGTRELTVGDGAWTAAYSGSSRLHGVLPGFDAGAAACFNMALSYALTEAGLGPPRLIQTRARVYLRNVDGAPTIQQIDLETEGDVPGLGEDDFRERAEEAKTGCIISRALGGVEEINLSATLAS